MKLQMRSWTQRPLNLLTCRKKILCKLDSLMLYGKMHLTFCPLLNCFIQNMKNGLLRIGESDHHNPNVSLELVHCSFHTQRISAKDKRH